MCLSKAQVEESNGATIEKLILYGGILGGIGGFALLWIVVGVALDWFGCCENRDCWSYEGTCPYCFVVRCIPVALGLGIGISLLGSAASIDLLRYIDSGCTNSAEALATGGEGGLNAAAIAAISVSVAKQGQFQNVSTRSMFNSWDFYLVQMHV